MSSWSTQRNILQSLKAKKSGLPLGHLFISWASISHKSCIPCVQGEARARVCCQSPWLMDILHCPQHTRKLLSYPLFPLHPTVSPAWLGFCKLPQMLFGTRQQKEWADKWIDGQVTDRRADAQGGSKRREQRNVLCQILFQMGKKELQWGTMKRPGPRVLFPADFVKIAAREESTEP